MQRLYNIYVVCVFLLWLSVTTLILCNAFWPKESREQEAGIDLIKQDPPLVDDIIEVDGKYILHFVETE